MAKTTTITYYRGTTSSWTINYSNANGVAGSTALFTVKANPGYDSDATDASAIVKHSVSLTANTGSLIISPSDIADSVAPGTYYYDIKVIDADGDIYPIVTGQFILKATPTNRLS